MIPPWVLFALTTALFSALRYIHIKNHCGSHPPEIIIFATRLTGAVVLLPVALLLKPVSVSDVPVFATVATLTVLTTAFSVVIQINLLQQENISRSVPYLSFIPVFMIPWSYLLLKELPALTALAGIILTCSGAYVINLKSGTGLLTPLTSIMSKRPARLMLMVAMLLALNTVCDKMAIAASSAFTYVYIWANASTMVMGLICLRKHKPRTIISALGDKYILAQSLFWVVGYSCQMLAIKSAFGIQSGTTYVRALTLLNILISVILGGALFREKNLLRKSLATLLMVVGSVVIVLSTR